MQEEGQKLRKKGKLYQAKTFHAQIGNNLNIQWGSYQQTSSVFELSKTACSLNGQIDTGKKYYN